MSGDKSWPDLVGKSADEAVEIIEKENSKLSVIKLTDGSPITTEFRNDRVRVFHDDNGKVVSKPQIG